MPRLVRRLLSQVPIHQWPSPPSSPLPLQVLADLRRQQREATDSAELAASREARLRGELAEVGWGGKECNVGEERL